MSEHKWATAESRYAAVSEVDAREFKTSEERDKFIECRALATWKFSPIDRYTEQQLKLEAKNERWVLVDKDVEIESGIFIDIHYKDEVLPCTAEHNVYVDEGAIAYRLSNADGIKDGVKSIHKHESSHEGFEELAAIDKPESVTIESLNIGPKDVIEGATLEKYITVKIEAVKPEWKNGLPPANSECEVEINKETSGFIDCEILFISNEWAVFNCKYGELAYKTSKLEFRPFQTELDKIKTLLMPAIRQYRHNNSDEFVTGYDRDEVEKLLLSMPKESS